VSISLSAIGNQALASLNLNAAGQPRDGDGDNGIEPSQGGAAARPQLPPGCGRSPELRAF